MPRASSAPIIRPQGYDPDLLRRQRLLILQTLKERGVAVDRLADTSRQARQILEDTLPPDVRRDDLLAFTQHTFPGYQVGPPHRILADALERAARTATKTLRPGEEPLRRLLVTFPPRHGKPLAEGTRVLMADGSRRPIEQVAEGDWVISGQGRACPVSGVFLQGELPCVRIETQTGRSVVAALDHPFLTPEGWVNAGDLVPGMALANVCEPQTRTSNIRTPEECALAGYFVGDGCTGFTSNGTGQNANIVNGDTGILADVLRCASLCGFATRCGKNHGGRNEATRIAFSAGRHSVRDWLRDAELAGKTSYTKRVPAWVFTAGRDGAAAFIAAYCACDGFVNKKGAARDDLVIEHYSVNRALLEDLQHLLLRFGIQSRLVLKNGRYKGERHVSWRLAVTSQDDVARYASAIGPFVRGEKGERLREWKPLRTRFDVSLRGDVIASVTPCGPHPCRCITVGGDHTYTAEDFVVHNTELTSIRFPAWVLGNYPDARVIETSYSADLALYNSASVRNVVAGSAFHGLFPNVKVDFASRSAEQWRIAGRRGGIRAAGVGGGITGFGANIFIIDDPFKDRQEADSQATRAKVWGWYTSTAYTRLEGDDGVMIVVMTRWHEDDLMGRLLAAEGSDPKADKWFRVHLKALAEPADPNDPHDTPDPLGRADGEPLWPGKFSTEALLRIKANVEDDWDALYQGRPLPPDGVMFQRSFFPTDKILDPLNPADAARLADPGIRWVRFWDLATSIRKEGDYTVGAKVGVDRSGNLFIAEIKRLKKEWPDAREIIIETALADGSTVTMGVEKVAFQTAAVQELMNSNVLLNITIHGIRPKGDKKDRAAPWASRAKAGKVYLVKGDWNAEFLSEICSFPHGKKDDQVDGVSGCVDMLVLIGALSTARPQTVEMDDTLLPSSAASPSLAAARSANLAAGQANLLPSTGASFQKLMGEFLKELQGDGTGNDGDDGDNGEGENAGEGGGSDGEQSGKYGGQAGVTGENNATNESTDNIGSTTTTSDNSGSVESVDNMLSQPGLEAEEQTVTTRDNKPAFALYAQSENPLGFPSGAKPGGDTSSGGLLGKTEAGMRESLEALALDAVRAVQDGDLIAPMPQAAWPYVRRKVQKQIGAWIDQGQTARWTIGFAEVQRCDAEYGWPGDE